MSSSSSSSLETKLTSQMSKFSPDDHEFVVPSKAIKVPDDMIKWHKSEAYFEYLGFLLALNESVQGKTLDAECPRSSVVDDTIKMLKTFDDWIEAIPPIDQPQRFGNKAFRNWHAKLLEDGLNELKKVLPEELHRASTEVVQYLYESFGNSTRIDYGTGHEMAFVMFLCCMFKINAYKTDDKTAVVVKVFNRYLQLVRKLQLTYRMEPAGSHGVWSLDDYQFVPFVWGSSQLVGHPRIEPQQFLDKDVLENFSEQFMFLSCIEFISQVKTGPFAEHSNQLWNVSAVASWSKVNSGLIKMYKAEILAKFPVVQHVLFGSLLPITPAPIPASSCKPTSRIPPTTRTSSAH